MLYVWFEIFAINSCIFTNFLQNFFVDVHPCLTPLPPMSARVQFSLTRPPPSLRTSFMDDLLNVDMFLYLTIFRVLSVSKYNIQGQAVLILHTLCLEGNYKEVVTQLSSTSFNPQNLRNIIKKVAKISITQINYYRTCLSKQQYFSMYLISHKFYRFRLVVDINIIT